MNIDAVLDQLLSNAMDALLAGDIVAAEAALAPTTAELQADAHQLVDRMLAVTGN